MKVSHFIKVSRRWPRLFLKSLSPNINGHFPAAVDALLRGQEKDVLCQKRHLQRRFCIVAPNAEDWNCEPPGICGPIFKHGSTFQLESKTKAAQPIHAGLN